MRIIDYAERYTRRRRKLFVQLASVEQEMERVRNSNPFPEHAPTSCRIISRQIRELRVRWYEITARISRIEADDPDVWT